MLRHLIAPLLLAACAGLPAPAEPQPGESINTDAPSPCLAAARLAAVGDERARAEAVLAMAPEEREPLALDLVPCLGDRDPDLRDGVAFGALSQLMRSQLVGLETVMSVGAELQATLAGPDDADGFAKPFAVLALAEVARTDRITPWMGPEERSALIASANAYLAALDDYRGFSREEGWRHGVAHTADLLMQLSINPQLTKEQAGAILAAVALKAGPADHAYVFGESERLAAPVLFLARRDFFNEDEWTDWFLSLWPAEDSLRENAYGSEAALAKLHNLRAFAQTVYVSAEASNNETYEPLVKASFALLNSLP